MTAIVMKIEHEHCPLCLETLTPEFSWVLTTDRQNFRQVGCQIRVLDDLGSLYWDSGYQETDCQKFIYAGLPLPPETTFSVQLTVQDHSGDTVTAAGTFRTGLFAKSFSAPVWQGAKWIGTGTRNLWAPSLTVFRLSCEITLTEDSTSAGLILGANDPRLMDRDKNIWGLEARRHSSYIYLSLDASGIACSQQAHLKIFRVGYSETDTRETPLYDLPIPLALLNPENLHCPHTLTMECIYGETDLFLDDVQINAVPADANPWETGKLNLNPAGCGGDFTAFPALCDIGCKLESGQSAFYRNLTVRNVRQPSNALACFWQDGIAFSGGERGFFRIFDPSQGGIPLVRSEFFTDLPRRAYLTITARGIYEAYLNGEKIGSDYLAPGLTHYNKTHMYQVLDITDLLRAGKNALAIELSEGWWSGAITFRGVNWNFWGDVQSVLCKLTLEYADGSKQFLVSGPDTFTASNQGPIRYGSLFQGQVYDAWYEANVSGWKAPDFSGNWDSAVEIPLTEETAVLGHVPSMKDGFVDMSHSGCKVLGQIGSGVRCAQQLTAKSMTEPRPGVFVYDFGQNISGIPDITLPGGCPGQEVMLRYGEFCYPDMPEYAPNQNMLMVENLRAAHATDTVYLGENPIHFCPKFTFHGFRYMEITGLDAPLPVSQVKARAISSVETLTAGFRCSNQEVNRLFENICWSLRDNFLSIPTDCPQRNERMGWSGDLSVFAPTAVYLSDALPFLHRHMISMEDLQFEDGMFPDITPVASGFGGILWGSAGITVPWAVYQQYGDKTILSEHYDAMVRYMHYLMDHVSPETGLQTAGELGDWLGPQVGKTENALLWTAYYLYDLQIMSQVARILGRSESPDFQQAYDEGYRVFNDTYFDPITHRTVYSCEDAARGNRMPFQPVDLSTPLPPKEPGGKYRMDTQTSYCVPLALGIVADTHKCGAEAQLAAFCARENPDDDGILRPAYSLMTGFIGTAWLLNALSSSGRDDIAYKILQNRKYPSWLYPVTQGATTIWERLDSYTIDRGFGGHNSMNSFNHYAFGAVGQWLMSRCLGITAGEPGFAKIILSPTPDPTESITWAEGWCDTPAGRIYSRWAQDGEEIRYSFTVPSGGTCTLTLPGMSETISLAPGNHNFTVPLI